MIEEDMPLNADTESDNFIERATSKFGAADVEEKDGDLFVKGEKFDPNVHTVEDDGLPRFNAKGMLARKRGGKKKSTANFKPTTIAPKRNTTKNDKEKYYASAAETVGLYQSIKVVVLGAKSDINTIQTMVDALAELNEKHNFAPRCPIEARVAGIFLQDVAVTLSNEQVQLNLKEKTKRVKQHVMFDRITKLFKRKVKDDENATDKGRGINGNSGQSGNGENCSRETTCA